MSGSGTDYTTTPNLGLYKPTANMAVGFWGDLLNSNADAIDAAIHFASGGGPFLPLAGGNVVGSTTFTASVTSGAGSVPSLLQTTWNVTNTGGSADASVQHQTSNLTNINTAAGQSIWANSDSIAYQSPTPSTSAASYVARRCVSVNYTARGSVAGAPGLWAGIFDIVDLTGNPSSVAGQMLSLEVDIEAAGLDDANIRQGLVVVGVTRGYPTPSSSEFARGLGLFSADAGVTFKDMFTFSTRFNRAGLNLSTSVSVGGAPAIWLADGHKLAWNTAGSATTYWDTAAFSGAGGIHFSASVDIDGAIYTPGALTVGGLAILAGGANIAGANITSGRLAFPSNLPTNAANDAAAATAGVPVGSVYRNGSALQVRVA